MNVLIIGSTQSFSDTESSSASVVHEKAFNPTAIATNLQSILSQDPAITETVNVEFENVYKTKGMIVPIGGSGSAWSFTFRCYSLAQHFMWPENKATRMANLRGEGDHQWDYIVLCEDPYIMTHFPGMYAEGVKLIQSEIAKSANPAQLILLSQWPENDAGASSSASFSDVVHRVGDSGGIPVAPGAKAWASYTSKDTSSAHPTPKGQYLAAAAIYSKMFSRSASSSGYNHSSPPAAGDAMADHVWSEVQAVAPGTEYTGKYTTQNAFQMEYFRDRTVDWDEGGSSTEGGFANGVGAALSSARVRSIRRGGTLSDPLDMFYSRGSDVFEADKQYNYGNRLDLANRVHGFPMGDHRGTSSTEQGQLTMRYGIDKRYYQGSSFTNGTDLGVAYSMVREGEIAQNVRGIPVRLLWAKMEHANLGLTSHRDSWHLSNELDRAVGAYLFTVLTGRCPVEAEPADNTSTAWKQWWCRKMGYETAWQMAHLTTRAPGFRVLPSSSTALTVTPSSTETMTVQFMLPPQSDVTVTVSSSDTSAAIVGPKTLVFTPLNYNVPQSVTVAGVAGSTSSAPFNVVYSTSSDDPVYDDLSDSWAYTTTRTSTSLTHADNGTANYSTPKNFAVTTNLGAAGANSGNTTLVGANHGTLAWSGSEVVYTPDTDHVGIDGFAYASLNSGTLTTGYIAIEVIDGFPDGSVRAEVVDSIATEEGQTTGTVSMIREGATTSALSVNFSLSGTATLTDDYTLSATSPVTIPAGQSSVTITLTAVDDNVFGEQIETASITVVAGSGYIAITSPATISIVDNDNNAPVVDAGPNQTISLSAGVSFTPGITYDPITGDEDSGISSDKTYTHAIDFGSDTSRALINGVQFQAGGTTFGTNVGTSATIGTGTTTIATANAGNTNAAPYLNGALPCAMENLVKDMNYNNSTGLITLTGLTPGTHYKFRLYNRSWGTGTRIQNIGFGTDGVGTNISQAEYTGTFYQDDATQPDPGFATANQVYALSFDYSLPSGVTSLNVYINQVSGGTYHLYGLTNEEVGSIGATATLDGTVTDPEETPATTWTLVSSDPIGQAVTFGNASDVDTTATFTEAGSYVLRLTADDGYGPVYDEVTIIVNPAQSYTLTVTNGSGDGDHATGAEVAIVADAPAAGYYFAGWTTSDGGSFADASAASTNYTMPGNDAEVTATYAINTAPVVDAGANRAISLSSSSPWTPANIAPVAWYDASDEDTLWADDGITPATADVQRWDDKSGNNHHAVASGTKPTYTSASSSVSSTDSAPMVLPADLYSAASSGCLVWVGTQVTGGGGWGNYGANNNIHSPWTSNYMYSAFLSASRRSATTATPGMLGKQTLQSRVQTGTHLEMWSDGTQIYNGVQTFKSTGLETKFFDQGSYSLNELVFLSDADIETREKAEGYLAHKWGLTASLPDGHPYKISRPLSNSGVSVTLSDASATDADGQPLTTRWTIFSKDPTDTPDPTFDNDTLVATTVTFSVAGTYTLRLTADDGTDTAFDEVTITVNPPPSAIYTAWAGGTFANPFTATGPTDDQDGDSMSNLMEFAFGTDPTLQDSDSLAIDGSANGSPVPVDAGDGVFEYYFVRRKDHGTSGSVNYTVQFSDDLTGFTDNVATPTFVTDSSANPDYEVVKVPYPAGTRFGRIEVTTPP